MTSLILNRGQLSTNIKEFLASTTADMEALSVFNVAPGSKCLCLDSFVEYILSPELSWVPVPASNNGGNSDGPIDLEGYATEEYVDQRIAFLLNNDTIDLDSIAELAKVLEQGGADLVEIRTKIEEIVAALDKKCPMETFISFAAEANKKHEEIDHSIKQEIAIREESDEAQNAILNRHDIMLHEIARENLYRAQELRPLLDNDTSYAVKYDGSTLNMQRRTDTNITAVRLEGDDIVFRKLSGNSIAAEEITYRHNIEGYVLETGDNREKPLYVIGLDDYATSDSGYKIILDNNNNGIAANSDCSDINYKEEYANVIPCFKIVDYFYSIDYTNKVPTSLTLLGGFFRKDENDGWTMTKVGKFTDVMHQYHISFEGNTVTIDCPTWPSCNGTFNFMEVEGLGVTIEGSEAFSFIPLEEGGYKFTVANLFHSATIASLSGEYDVEIRQYDAWHEGHMPGDNAYVSPIKVEYDKVVDPCAYPRYYFAKNNDRTIFYKAYNESWGWKSGPFGMKIENGEFEKTTNINNPNAAVVKYMIDGNLLITGAYEIQEITLDELAAGRGTVITGNTPYAVNPGTGWGTSNPEVTDNNKRLGMFSYLTNNHDFKKGGYVHPVGNYNVCKIENLPVALVDGSTVKFYEIMTRGFETTLHSEYQEANSENGTMYVQFISGRTTDAPDRLRHFYRTLTVGYDADENGKLTTRRRTWSPLTEIVTSETLKAYDSKIVLLTTQNETFEAQIATLEEQVNTYENKYSELEQQYNTLQETVEELESVIGQISVLLPSVTVPQEVRLTRTEYSNEYATIVTGTYSPIDATVNLDIIITDTSIGDGGQFYYITDQRINDGSYEVTIKNTPGAAGTPHPSALQATVTANNITVTKISPITY